MSEREYSFFRRPRKTDERAALPTEHHADSAPTAPKTEGTTRRDFLKGLVAAGTVLGGAAAPIEKVFASDPGSHDSEGEEGIEDREISPDRFAIIDIATGSAVLAAFGERVIWQGALKELATGKGGVPLGKLSVGIMNGLAAGRIAALEWFGGKEGKHEAEKEIEELQNGYKLLPWLVLLSDMTTTELKVDPDEVLQKSELERIDYDNVQRPELNASIEEWEQYYEKLNKDIVVLAAEISGISGALAPIVTTYGSSALANRMKQGMVRALYEQSFAKSVIDRKKETHDTEAIIDEEIHDLAAQRTDDAFNGWFGYSKLALTLSANSQGAFGAGDPPEGFFLQRHSGNSERVKLAEGAGLATAQITTLVLNAAWLQRIGALRGNAAEGMRVFLRAEAKTIQAIGGSLIPLSGLGSVTFNRGAVYAKAIEKAVMDEQDPQMQVRLAKLLGTIPKARLQFDYRTYVENKISASGEAIKSLSRWMTGSEDDDVHITDDDLQSMEAYRESDAFQGLLDAYATMGDRSKLSKTLHQTDVMAQKVRATQLAEVFQALVDAQKNQRSTSDIQETADSDGTRGAGEGVSNEGVEGAENVVNIGDKIQASLRLVERLQKMDTTTRKQRVAKAREMLHIHEGDSADMIYSTVNSADRGDLYKAMRELVGINGPAGEHDEDHDVSLLSHSAWEVAFALMTQIPVVASASRMANYAIPAMVGIEKGVKPTPRQVEAVIATSLGLVAGMSAFADNVAAYMFGEDSIMLFLKNTYGDDVLERYPSLGHLVSILPLKIAEQAGSLTKIGNGPNFAHKKYRTERSDANKQGITVVEEELEMTDTFKNTHSHIANTTLVAVSTALFVREIEKIEAELAAKTAKAA